jgi:succinate dehydrogenase/fumarate reductase flavoprotein subunit
METKKIDILIIGGGLAAMMAALEAADSALAILMVSKGTIGNSGATLMAGANFAAVLPEGVADGDSVADHVNETCRAGAGINDRDLVQTLAANAPQDLLFLEHLGVDFIKRDGRFDLRMPPGHRRPRTVFTVNPGFPVQIRGKSITAPLRGRIRERSIPRMDGVTVIRLVVENGRIAGAIGVRRRTGEPIAFACRAVVLAGGGGGYLYEQSTNPADATGDSFALALEAGCSLRDMEFVQFFPCVHLEPPRVPIASPILSDGAVLRNRDGERFLKRYEPERMEMATRDAVSQAIYRELRGGGGIKGGVYLDVTGGPRDLLSFRFPDLIAAFRNRKIDLHTEWIRVAPAAHFFMGGVVIDPLCRTSVAGLYCAGEASGGIHGANRLSGNGLSDALVFGRIAGRSAVDYAGAHDAIPLPDHGCDPDAAEGGASIRRDEIRALRKALRKTMWEEVGIVRRGEGLAAALERMEGWRNFLDGGRPERPEDRSAFCECRSMLLAARAVACAALFREESRGAHFRDDYPQTCPRWERSISTLLERGAVRSAVIAPGS